MHGVLEGLPATYTCDMNASSSRTFMENEPLSAILSMTKRKAPGYDGIPIELFQYHWPTIRGDFLKMILKSMKEGAFHEGVIKGLISLIPKEGDSRDLNY